MKIFPHQICIFLISLSCYTRPSYNNVLNVTTQIILSDPYIYHNAVRYAEP
jgi:hypothetical protein